MIRKGCPDFKIRVGSIHSMMRKGVKLLFFIKEVLDRNKMPNGISEGQEDCWDYPEQRGC
jgi:hypothetical protein